MAIANKLTDEQFDYIKLTVKVSEHPVYGMHLQAKTYNEVLNSPNANNYDLERIKRSCAMTKGGFIREVAAVAKYLTYTSRCLGPHRITIATHRVIYMLYHDINLNEDQLINHIDGNTFNNHISNLEIVTAKENSHISKVKNKQLSTIKSVDLNGLLHVKFDHNGNFGSTKDNTLAETTQKLLNSCRQLSVDIDQHIHKFVEFTKYKTLEERLSILKINSYIDDAKTLYNKLLDFEYDTRIIKQAGVRELNPTKFRVSIRVDGATINFGTFNSLLIANNVAIKVRELKNSDPVLLNNIINSKPTGIPASEYFQEHL